MVCQENVVVSVVYLFEFSMLLNISDDGNLPVDFEQLYLFSSYMGRIKWRQMTTELKKIIIAL